MEQNYKKEIEKIIDETECPKNFECYKSNLESLSSVRDVGMESMVVCFEEDAAACNFSMSFGQGYFCRCLLRVFIAKNLKK